MLFLSHMNRLRKTSTVSEVDIKEPQGVGTSILVAIEGVARGVD